MLPLLARVLLLGQAHGKDAQRSTATLPRLKNALGIVGPLKSKWMILLRAKSFTGCRRTVPTTIMSCCESFCCLHRVELVVGDASLLPITAEGSPLKPRSGIYKGCMGGHGKSISNKDNIQNRYVTCKARLIGQLFESRHGFHISSTIRECMSQLPEHHSRPGFYGA